ncbi:hypothetical protein [Ornithinibacillus scapharcae]|uniref:hypothetical protein n=1 Tax=Ornithinibacillus scapharcae TaxID=1147159 RepID=UPI000225B085|nr:hypothetical protein [Ornithinibacillus scapharcae]
MGFTNIFSEEMTAEQLLNISLSERQAITQGLEYELGAATIFHEGQYEQVGYNIQYYAQPEESEDKGDLVVKQDIRFLKFHKYLKVNLIKSYMNQKDKAKIFLQIIFLDHINNKKKIVSFQDGKLLGDDEVDTNSKEIELPYDFTELSKEEQEFDTGDMTVQGLPCIQDGCCSFRYNGNPFNPLVKYNWCGANCGSGTPVNALDTCCRTHDYCYGSFKSYPSRCDCDQNLINCARNTDNAGTSRVIAAFQAKMIWEGC